MSTTLDVLATKLPSIEFKKEKKINNTYEQKMQSRRGGKQFVLRTVVHSDNSIVITLAHSLPFAEIVIGNRSATLNDPGSITNAIKSLERKAGCKLYYVLLIDTDGNYL